MQNLPYIYGNSPKSQNISPTFRHQSPTFHMSGNYRNLNQAQKPYFLPQTINHQRSLSKNGYNSTSVNSSQTLPQRYFQPGNEVPPRGFSYVQPQGKSNEKIIDLIERQTEVIGMLNQRILIQDIKNQHREKADLRARLRQLEVANSLKQKEIDTKIKPDLEIYTPKHRSKKPKSDHLWKILGKLILEKEN